MEKKASWSDKMMYGSDKKNVMVPVPGGGGYSPLLSKIMILISHDNE